jgi:predicted CoA-substrate-specific enzyme activase
MITLGIDIGSLSGKAVVLEDGRIRGQEVILTGPDSVETAEEVTRRALARAGCSLAEMDFTVSTGYGRIVVPYADKNVSEISCHARGAAHLFPGVRTILDMGGQDCKAIRCEPGGKVADFAMNDKCAAGTGRFLQSAAAALEMDLADLGPTALRGQRPVNISTTCTVFAESEVLSWLAKGKKIEDILLGVHRSIASRSIALLRRVGIEGQITFTGGVTKNNAMVAVLNDMLKAELNVSDESHYIGALGAALFALERIHKGREGTLEKEGAA